MCYDCCLSTIRLSVIKAKQWLYTQTHGGTVQNFIETSGTHKTPWVYIPSTKRKLQYLWTFIQNFNVFTLLFFYYLDLIWIKMLIFYCLFFNITFNKYSPMDTRTPTFLWWLYIKSPIWSWFWIIYMWWLRYISNGWYFYLKWPLTFIAIMKIIKQYDLNGVFKVTTKSFNPFNMKKENKNPHI